MSQSWHLPSYCSGKPQEERQPSLGESKDSGKKCSFVTLILEDWLVVINSGVGLAQDKICEMPMARGWLNQSLLEGRRHLEHTATSLLSEVQIVGSVVLIALYLSEFCLHPCETRILHRSQENTKTEPGHRTASTWKIDHRLELFYFFRSSLLKTYLSYF